MNRHVLALFTLICLSLAACAGPETGAPGSAPANNPAPPTQVDPQLVAQGEPLPALFDSPGTDGGDPITSDPNQPLIFALPTPGLVDAQGPLAGGELSATERAVRAVVKVQGCAQPGLAVCSASNGSGVLIHPNGLVLTALHVLVIDPLELDSRPFADFLISVSREEGQPAQPAYRALLAAFSVEQDVALLRLYQEVGNGHYLEPEELYLSTLPLSPERLDRETARNSLFVMGYPQAEWTVLQPSVSWVGYAAAGFLRVSPTVVQGYSGGPMLWERTSPYSVVGVVLNRQSDDNLGIRPTSQLGPLTWTDVTLRIQVQAIQARPVDEAGLPAVEVSLDLHTVDWAGRGGRVLAVAKAGEDDALWPSAAAPLTLQRSFESRRFVDQLPITMTESLVGLGPVPDRLHFVIQVRDGEQSQLLWNGEGWYRHELSLVGSQPDAPSPTATPTLTASPTATPVSATTIPTATFTPVPPTSTATSTATPTPALPIATPTPTVPAAGATWENPADNAVYVYVPAGEFMMGSADGQSDEQPVHTVYLDAYWIMRTEVTNAQYSRCVTAGSCTEPENSRWNDLAYAQHPVTHVDWSQATAYAAWAGGQLPTEAEWEKAARGTDGRIYPWGDSDVTSERANSWTTGPQDTVEVGKYASGVSPYGALDMAGNVWEWMADWYDSDYYANSPSRNPTGPAAGDARVVRGGSWLNYPDDLRAANRYRDPPQGRDYYLGFRLVSPGPLVSE